MPDDMVQTLGSHGIPCGSKDSRGVMEDITKETMSINSQQHSNRLPEGSGYRSGIKGKSGLGSDWPATVGEFVSFVSFDSLKSRAASTIQSFIAGLSFYHKLGGIAGPHKSLYCVKIAGGV